MRYYALTYQDHTTLVVKSEATLTGVLAKLTTASGISSPSGAIYNPKVFLTLSWITDPDKRQKLVAQVLDQALIG